MPSEKGGFFVIGTEKVLPVYARKGRKVRSEMAEEAIDNQAGAEEEVIDWQAKYEAMKSFGAVTF